MRGGSSIGHTVARATPDFSGRNKKKLNFFSTIMQPLTFLDVMQKKIEFFFFYYYATFDFPVQLLL